MAPATGPPPPLQHQQGQDRAAWELLRPHGPGSCAQIGHNYRTINREPARPGSRCHPGNSRWRRLLSSCSTGNARIAVVCFVRVFRPRYAAASWARTGAHNARKPVQFSSRKISGVCGRGSPPSCKLPYCLGLLMGGIAATANCTMQDRFPRSDTAFSGSHSPRFVAPFPLAYIIPRKNRL